MRYAYVMLTSFFENQTKKMDIHVYILQSSLTAGDKGQLENLVKLYSGMLHWFSVDEELFSRFPVTEDWTAEVYYRLLLPDVLPEDIDRILYLDVDIIINKSLEDLYFTDFGGKVLCVCKDICGAPFGDERDLIFEKQIQNGFIYFCSGMLLMNIKAMRGKYCFEDYMKLAQDLDYKMVAPDQDLLNYVHWNEVKIVDSMQYNLFAWIAYKKNIHYSEVKETVSIIHFSGPKPWAGKYVRYDIEQLWWDYAKKTPFYYEFLEECVYEAVREPMVYSKICSLQEEINSLAEGLKESAQLCSELYDMIESQKEYKREVGEYGIDEKKISFIICANNSLYYDECVWYINNLKVPAGFEIDIMGVTQAESMAQGYNAAMKESNAKYKVYLHQDVFIYNRYFIDDLLRVFGADDRIGLVGMIGGIGLPQDAVIWDAWNVGKTYGCNHAIAFPICGYQAERCEWIEVEAVDGMLMATQYDVEWREDLMLGWDFYDISQSLEFRRQGYKVAIPYQETPWCMHDCGDSKLIHYDEVRKKVLTEYKEFFSGEFHPKYNLEYYYIQERIFNVMKECLQNRMFEQALEVRTKVNDADVRDKDLQYILNILDIYLAEEKRDDGVKSFFDDAYTWDEIRDKYDRIKFIVRHAENHTNEEGVENLISDIDNKEISPQAVMIICKRSTVNSDRAIKRLINKELRNRI